MGRLSTGTILGSFLWAPILIGGGGYVTGLSLVGTTIAIRTDVYGAYIKGAGDTKLRPAFTPYEGGIGTLPNGASPHDPGFTENMAAGEQPGCFEIIVAPTDQTRIYGEWRRWIWVSSDTGHSWTKMNGLPANCRMNSNSGPQPHNTGRNWEADPTNKNVAMFTTQDQGLFYTLDGLNLTQIPPSVIGTNIAAADGWVPNWPYKVAVDPTSAVSGSCQIWYVAVQGVGIKKSTTGVGGSYSLMAGSPVGPITDLQCDAAGNVYCCDGQTNGKLYKCPVGTSTWAATAAPGKLVTFAFDPNNVLHGVAFDNNGGTTWTLDGSTWATMITGQGPNKLRNMYPRDVPWQGWGDNFMFKAGMARFRPSDSRLFATAGIGMFDCAFPTSITPGLFGGFNWYECIAGQEELVASDCAWPNGGNPFLVAEDRPFWTSPDLNDFATGPMHPVGMPHIVTAGYSCSVASDNPSCIVGLASYVNNASHPTGSECGISLDGGATMLQFGGSDATSPPVDNIGGCIRIGTQSSGLISIIPSNSALPLRTSDLGATWHVMSGLPGVPNVTITGNNSTPQLLTLTKGAVGAKDLFGLTLGYVSSIMQVNQGGTWNGTAFVGGTTYTRYNVTSGIGDFALSGNGIQWYATGAEPAAGTTYQVAYRVGVKGLHNAYYQNRRPIDYDATLGVFWLYSEIAGYEGIYKSADLVTWTKTFTGKFTNYGGASAKLTCVPGHGGHLFFSTGPIGGTTPGPLFFSGDGNGADWNSDAFGSGQVTGMTDVRWVAPGMAAPGYTYPAIYVYGKYNGEQALWWCPDFDTARTWQKITNYPNHSNDSVTCGCARMDVFGQGIVGFGGSSFARWYLDDEMSLSPVP